MRRRRTVPNENELEGLYLWRKDLKSENGSLTKAVELEREAVLGRLEEPLIVAPILEARRYRLVCQGGQPSGGKPRTGERAGGQFPSCNGTRKCTMQLAPYQGRFALWTRRQLHGLKKAHHCFGQKTGCFLAREEEELVDSLQRAFQPSARIT
jgi:hypothetical protein